jgi:hypothetical protein
MAIPTPYSYRQYQGDGVAKTFSVPFPYLERIHVHLYLDGKELVEGTDYNWTSGVQVQLTTALQAAVAGTPGTPAQVLTVRRITPEDDQIVQWKDGSYIISEDLNESDKQWLYLIQEHHDGLMQLHWGTGSVPGGGNPSLPLAWWNNLSRSKDPNKGKATELAQTIDKLDQLLGDWPADGKDKFIATTDAISARVDPYVQDGLPAPYGLPQKEQEGKQWFDTDELVQRFWDVDAGAWVTLANTGPVGPQGGKGDTGTYATIVQDLPPTVRVDGTPIRAGDCWFRSSNAQLYSWYDDGTSQQWVSISKTGPKGDQGIQGIQGIQGLKGDQGIQGPTGAASTVAGPTGPAGAKGDKGDTGAKGATGADGPTAIATAATLGAVKTGTNIKIAADGTISANLPGALVYRGAKDLTAAPPATPAQGDVYLSSKAGTIAAGWTGIGGTTTIAGDMVLWDGAKWDKVGSTGTGITSVTGSAPIKIAGTAAVPDVQVTDASTAAKGVVQLADAAAITAGAAGRVVDAAQLKAVSDADDWKRTGTTLAPVHAGDAVTAGHLLAGMATANPAGAKLQTHDGLTFPANQVASADPNTLDDYEEGIWTPTVAGSTTAGTATYGIQTGTYTKIGRVVTYTLYLNWSAGTGTGVQLITGLPFTVGRGSSATFSLVTGVTTHPNSIIAGYAEQNSSHIVVTSQAVGGGANINAQVAFNPAGQLVVSGEYFTP